LNEISLKKSLKKSVEYIYFQITLFYNIFENKMDLENLIKNLSGCSEKKFEFKKEEPKWQKIKKSLGLIRL
jgi:hypothetical protein